MKLRLLIPLAMVVLGARFVEHHWFWFAVVPWAGWITLAILWPEPKPRPQPKPPL